MIDSVFQDVKYALRSFRRTPQFTAAAVMTLALGIGANTAMFSLGDATALRPPDVPRASEIVRVFTSSQDTPFGARFYAARDPEGFLWWLSTYKPTSTARSPQPHI